MDNKLSMHASLIVPIYYCDTSLFRLIDGCLLSIFQHAPQFNLIVVNDGSPMYCGHWAQMVESRGGSWLESPENHGYSQAVNSGMCQAEDDGWDDVVVVMNDDIILQAGQLDRFLELDWSKPTIASPRDTASDTSDRFGACFGMTWAAGEILGGLDTKYRNFYSDTDLYDRAKKEGVEVIKWEDIVLDHPESSTFKLLDKKKMLADDAARFGV